MSKIPQVKDRYTKRVWVQVLYEATFKANTSSYDGKDFYDKHKVHKMAAEFPQLLNLYEVSHFNMDVLRQAAEDDLWHRFVFANCGYKVNAVTGLRYLEVAGEAAIPEEEVENQRLDVIRQSMAGWMSCG